ncbi:MAG: tyrosine/phenylalanine carboxypeptidase domain-containing protein [Minisyncoccia bacterium]
MNKKNKGVLGMNARNLLYIRPYNRKKSIDLANNKLRSKEALFKAGIPVSKVFGIVRNRRELEVFNWNSFPKSFVVKPNHGGGGEGIKVIFGQNKDASWVSTKGEKITIADLSDHIMNIFEGFYSLSGISDIAFFEERIQLSKAFKPYAYKGIPDVRVIVFNKVPVMAMLRLPTRESEGKANLHQGGIGVGIDIATGLTTHAIMYDQSIEKTPDTKLPLRGIKIPHWREILEISIKCQEISKLGYLGVDVAIDKDSGPIVLEINAHPGLSIQNANLASLKYRLQKVTGINVKSEAHGIRIAQNIFGAEAEHESREIPGKQIIGIIETIKVKKENAEGIEEKDLKAKIDTGADSSSMDRSIARELGYKDIIDEFDEEIKKVNIDINSKKEELDQIIKDKIKKWGDNFDTVFIKSSHGVSYRLVIKMKINLAGVDIISKFSIADRSHLEFPVIIGRKNLGKFLVDPSKGQSIIAKASESRIISNLKEKGSEAIVDSIIEAEKDKAEINLQAKEKLLYYSKEIEKIAGQFNDIFSFINPFGRGGRDYSLEISEFMENIKNKEYNPTFSYPNLIKLEEKQCESILNKLDDISKMAKMEESVPLKQIVYESTSLMKYKINFLLAAKGEDEAKSFEFCKKIYGDVNADLVLRAEEVYGKILEDKDEEVTDEKYIILREKIFSAEEIKDKFKDVLEEMDLSQWDVAIDKESSQIDVKFSSVKYSKPTIVIPEERRLNGVNLMKRIMHEIVHIKTNTNNKGFGLGGTIFGRDYELYQEGFARIVENDFMNDIFGVKKELPNPYYVLVMDKIKKGCNYHKSFDYLVKLKIEEYKAKGMDAFNAEIISQKEAFFICRRVFRGFRTSLEKGGMYFTKDKIYLEGEILAKKIYDAGFGEYLVSGKIDPCLLSLFIKMGIISRDNIKHKIGNDLEIYRKMFL